ncbi:unnamed protein product, partial [Rotaria sordida]
EFTAYRSNDNHNSVLKHQPSQNVLRTQSMNTMNVLDKNDEENESNFDTHQYTQNDVDEDELQKQVI